MRCSTTSCSARSPRTWCSSGCAGLRPVVVHGGGPQINAMFERLGIAGEFRGGLRVTTPETMRCRPDGAVRPGGPRARRADQRARPVRGRHVRRGRAPVHRRPPHRHRGRRAGRRRPGRRRGRGEPGRGARPRQRRPYPGGLDGRPRTPTASCTTSTPTPPRRRWPSRLGAAKLVVLTDVEGLYTNWPDRDQPASARSTADELAALLPALSSRHGAEDGGLPAGRPRVESRGPT